MRLLTNFLEGFHLGSFMHVVPTALRQADDLLVFTLFQADPNKCPEQCVPAGFQEVGEAAAIWSTQVSSSGKSRITGAAFDDNIIYASREPVHRVFWRSSCAISRSGKCSMYDWRAACCERVNELVLPRSTSQNGLICSVPFCVSGL